MRAASYRTLVVQQPHCPAHWLGSVPARKVEAVVHRVLGHEPGAKALVYDGSDRLLRTYIVDEQRHLVARSVER